MPRYTRTSVLRAQGLRPTTILALRQRARRATASASDLSSRLAAVAAVTGPVVERARERGTDASGTIRKIDRLVSEALA